MTTPGIPNDLVLSTSCFGSRLRTIEDQAFAAVAMGFRRLELGLSDSPPAMNGFDDTRRETGIEVTSLISGCLKPKTETMASHLLASTNDDERERALNSVRRHVQMARRLGSNTVVLSCNSVVDKKLNQESDELERLLQSCGLDEDLAEKFRAHVQKVQRKGQRQLDHLCRSLHALLSEFPGLRLAVEPGVDVDDLLSFDAMGWVLSDLHKQGLGYWHDIGRIHQRELHGLPGQGAWLDAYAERMVGIHLQDAAQNEFELPPGRGEVDFRLLAEYLPKQAARVLEVNPRHGRAEILASVQYLVDKGF
jgi:sugar phosphate isomerase/epimerase